jgi:hypothetical protein
VWLTAGGEREPAADAQSGEGDDEGVRQPAEDIGEPVDGADDATGQEHRQDDKRRGIDRLVDVGADDRGERQVRADRQVDAAGEDHELLAHRDDGDDRGLRRNIRQVAGLQKVRRPEGDANDQQYQDQNRPHAQQSEPEIDRVRGLRHPVAPLCPRCRPLRPFLHTHAYVFRMAVSYV